MKKVAFITFGCKTNQYETNLMREMLEKQYDIASPKEKCDIYIVNSCAVTSKASKESRLTARKLKRAYPSSEVLYTGCDSYLSRQSLEPEGIYCLGNSFKHSIDRVIESPFSNTEESTKTYPINKTINSFAERNRAFLKIQEGCNNHCTYCIIPFVRGRERYKSKELVVREVETLSDKFKEIVITGINLGAYRDLKDLLKKISHSKSRIRISSIEPMYVDKELIDIISSGYFAKHLHIPLQSGSERILKLMGRSYTLHEYEKIVDYAHKKGIFVGTDIIVGFYSEGEKEFRETYNFIKNIPLVYGHVFTYSRRVHTPAYSMKTPLERGPTVRERRKKLAELFKEKYKERMHAFVGNKTEIVFEDRTVNKGGKMYKIGLASEYFRVLTEDNKTHVIVKNFDGEYAYA